LFVSEITQELLYTIFTKFGGKMVAMEETIRFWCSCL